jgi:8-amino-7-oxononanoate synthase
MTLFTRWSGVLDDLRERGRYRTLRSPAGIDLTSNDYLGYGRLTRPECSTGVVELHKSVEASGRATPPLSRSGTASRLLCNHPVWDDVESAVAAWHRAESALVMTSGYVANEGLLATVVDAGDWVASDELVHASIIDGLRLSRPEKYRFHHNDLDHLEAGLRSAARPAGRQLFVVTESLFGMDGDRAPLAAIVGLAERYGAHVIVDEAHATGCFGPSGSGLVDEAGLRDRVLATVHTGGKALAVPGAYICGSRLLKEYLLNRCRHLIFTTSPPPAVGAWWLDMLPRVQADDAGRGRLHVNVAAVRAALADRDVVAGGTDYIVPMIAGDDDAAVRLAARLQEQGYDVRPIRPPTVPAGTARVRISVHADHHPAMLRSLADAVAEVLRP